MKGKLKRFIRIGLLMSGALGVAVVSLLLYTRFRPRPTPAGQPPLVRLKQENFNLLLQQFNSQSEGLRVLVMLSPT